MWVSDRAILFLAVRMNQGNRCQGKSPLHPAELTPTGC